MRVAVLLACWLGGGLVLASCAEGNETTPGGGSDSDSTGAAGPAGTGGSGAATSTGQGAGGTGGRSSGPGGAGNGGAGGAAGGSSAGGGGAGGQAQGGGGAGDPCAATASDDACDMCRKPACCAELTTCAGDSKCTCWIECIDQHTNDMNKTVICGQMCGDPASSLNAINGVFNCQQACASCPPVPWA